MTLGSRLNTGKSELGGRNRRLRGADDCQNKLVSNAGGGGDCPLEGNDRPGPSLGS